MQDGCFMFLALAVVTSATAAMGNGHESVLDRKVYIQESLVLDVPQVPPLCDSIDGLTKGKIDIGGRTMKHSQYGMVLDRKWIEERLKTPFVRK